MNNNRGMTYIEVLMATALLSLVIAPVVTGFFQSAQNQQAAIEIYEASLYAANLLTEAQAYVNTGGESFADIVGNTQFDTEYQTSLYDYCLYVYVLRNGSPQQVFAASTNAVPATGEPPSFSGYALPTSAAKQLEPISGDCTLVLTEDADVLVTGDGYLTVSCENAADVPVHLNVYTAHAERVTVECTAPGEGVTVFICKPAPEERIIMTEVYNKKGVLLNRLSATAMDEVLE